MTRPAHRLLRRARTRLARIDDRTLVLLAVLTSVGGTVWALSNYGQVRIPSVAIIVMVISSLLLTGRAMILIVAVLTACVVIVLTASDDISTQISISGGAMLVCVATVSIVQAVRRDSLGLHRMSAETVLSRVAGRLRAQGIVPQLPAGWQIGLAQRSSFGAAFAGDFVSSRVHDCDGAEVLDVVLVDVSGRGIEAGSRALLLSGAVGGLLGAVPPAQFLPKVNDYLRAQGTTAEFATASYLRVYLATGNYELHSAGHPPPIVWGPPAQSTRRASCTGIVLGVVDDLDGKPDLGRLEPGGGIVLYSDGVVEERSADLEAGLARLERHVYGAMRDRSSARLADELVALAPANNDDQTVVVVRYAADPSELAAG